MIRDLRRKEHQSNSASDPTEEPFELCRLFPRAEADRPFVSEEELVEVRILVVKNLHTLSMSISIRMPSSSRSFRCYQGMVDEIGSLVSRRVPKAKVDLLIASYVIPGLCCLQVTPDKHNVMTDTREPCIPLLQSRISSATSSKTKQPH